MYYLRTKAATDPIKFTLDKQQKQEVLPLSTKVDETRLAEIACSLDDPEGCEMCSG